MREMMDRHQVKSLDRHAVKSVARHGAKYAVREMIASDLENARRDALVAREGFKTYKHHE